MYRGPHLWVQCTWRAALSLAILSGQGGCSSEPRATTELDAAIDSGSTARGDETALGTESGAVSDSRIVPDDGSVSDSSGLDDNGAVADSDAPRDGGGLVDGGTLVDRSTVPDGEVLPDGGPQPGDGGASDARIPTDAGRSDGSPPLSCGPGQRLDPLDKSVECSGGFCICRTYAPDAGGLVPVVPSRGVSTDVISLALPTPMQAGISYTFSVLINNFNYAGDVELWGSKAECGAGLERLFVEPFATKTYCSVVLPSDDYTHVLFVRQFRGIADGSIAAQNYDSFMACPAGTCP